MAAGSSVDKATKPAQEAGVACGPEAVKVLNCAAKTPFDEEACQQLLLKLRKCIESKKVASFTILGEEAHPQPPEGA
ncbi:hypothetical protein KFL_000140560 [Klebsormidium nitens]|uniref:CHCH domain-containing protein n=1 Tax=Klebsormidium nitens TaxID=105231 RepID=A0A1Y1HJ47_KLENI|nr:hypothetical protein KFL_000140560 [Klebsormidium nitens]|eukprot:GAQ78535.1 hypothetical protein KFL_000140560 [Klebsormidium nitens]